MKLINDPEIIAQLAIGAFIAIVFLQSGLDKILDWKGNHSWISGHFKNTFISGFVTPMLGLITLSEMAAGLFAICGIGCLLFYTDSSCIYYSILIALVSLLMLLFGQRIAKDYDGAKTIAIYFGVILISLFFF